jgi:hypothetical protein
MRRGAASTVTARVDLRRVRVRVGLLVPHLLQLKHLDEAVVAAGGHLRGFVVPVEFQGHREGVEFGAAVGALPDVALHLDDDVLLQILVEIERDRLEDFLARHHERAPIVRRPRVSLKKCAR